MNAESVTAIQKPILWHEGAQSKTRYQNSYLRISHAKSGRIYRPQFCITFSSAIMREMRWLSGDRVQIGLRGSQLCIRRVQSGGYALSPSGITAKNRDRAIGKPVCCNTRATSVDWMASIADHTYTRGEVFEEGGMLVVNLHFVEDRKVSA